MFLNLTPDTVYHTQELVVLGGLSVMPENGKMSDKLQIRVDILTTLFTSSSSRHSLGIITFPGQGGKPLIFYYHHKLLPDENLRHTGTPSVNSLAVDRFTA